MPTQYATKQYRRASKMHAEMNVCDSKAAVYVQYRTLSKVNSRERKVPDGNHLRVGRSKMTPVRHYTKRPYKAHRQNWRVGRA